MAGSLKIVKDDGTVAEACGTSQMLPIEGDGLDLKSYRGNVALVTLGCAKNQVDSEVMLGVLESNGFQIVNDVTNADVAIVNTCGFLESSINESIDCVLDISKLKETGRLRRLIVAGCMVERFKGDIRKALPEVDSFVGLDDILNIANAAGGTEMKDLFNAAARPYFLYDDSMPRKLSTQKHTAYVKVSEGCDRPCTFCIIPKIRGAMRSRGIDSVVSEIKMLGSQGVKEINLVAQDLTSYGKDRKGEDLKALLKAIDGAGSVSWVRLLYAYPIGIDQELLELVSGLPSICNYLDLPLQHSSEDVLRLMQRPVGRYAARNIIKFIKEKAPSIKMRTTFIVGFPGETEKDIADLENFVSEGHFTSVGVFTYSKEEGTPSYDLKGHISEEEKAARRERIMLAQQSVVEKNLAQYIGKTIDVIVEGGHEETDLLLCGRAEFQAPEVDGSVIINDIEGADIENLSEESYIGKILPVTITEVNGYDLIGKLNFIC
jgi:ribosomal protein S12 methylthiotransferase